MDWQQITQSVIAGVLYFSAWTLLLTGVNMLRNRRLEWRLRRLIKPGGVKYEDHRIHLIVANYTHVAVTVRRVELATAEGERIPLDYSGDTGEVDLDYGDLREFVDHWKATHGERFSRAGLGDRGFVELPPQTAGYWTLREDELQQPREFSGCCAVVEYPTIFRSQAILRLAVPGKVVEAIREAYEDHLEGQLRRGAAPAAGTGASSHPAG